jgi:hypothetical protein
MYLGPKILKQPFHSWKTHVLLLHKKFYYLFYMGVKDERFRELTNYKYLTLVRCHRVP